MNLDVYAPIFGTLLGIFVILSMLNVLNIKFKGDL